MTARFVGLTAPVRDSDIGMPRVMVEVGYLHALGEFGLVPLVLSPIDDANLRDRAFDLSSGLVLSGGEDVDPARYGQSPDGARTVSPERDAMELELLRRALERRIPVLAICRGIQLLNVGLGGTLYQDLETKMGTAIDHDRFREFAGHIHAIRPDGPELLAGVFPDGEFVQNSAHHQGIQDLAPALTAVARAPDGLVEAVEYRQPGAAWTVGVQWHPERKLEDPSGTNRRLFERFAAAVRETTTGVESTSATLVETPEVMG
ncbi:MAG: gamma-glutamyl-gamma-aminobutyrate hydrolase family protein [marine benthic group bacterium]|nr:gamma-glutamyl-gamma-aminobutyrate hydrolase family protein [Gemmatimonadota bacterium]